MSEQEARDRIAEKALQGLMSTDFWAKFTFSQPHTIGDLVRISYMVADAMLDEAAREVQP